MVCLLFAPPAGKVSKPEFPLQDPEPVVLMKSIKNATTLRICFCLVFGPMVGEEEKM
jgi:hypothetical protein